MKNGNLKIFYPSNFSRIILTEFCDEIIDHYDSNKPKPIFSIPKTFSKLILEIQDHYQLGFTKIIGELLNLSRDMQIKIDETLERQFISLSKKMPEDAIVCDYNNIGFACIISTRDFDLHDDLINVLTHYEKQYKNIKKWIVVGNNIKHK